MDYLDDHQLAVDLMRDEGRVGRAEAGGFTHTAYPDPLSPLARAQVAGMRRLHGLSGEPWTIGYGHTGPEVYEGLEWSEEAAQEALAADILRHGTALAEALPWFPGLDPVRRRVLLNMAFNLGVQGLLGFRHTLAFVEAGNYAQAGAAMLESKWATQVKTRAARLASEMSSGRYGTRTA